MELPVKLPEDLRDVTSDESRVDRDDHSDQQEADKLNVHDQRVKRGSSSICNVSDTRCVVSNRTVSSGSVMPSSSANSYPSQTRAKIPTYVPRAYQLNRPIELTADKHPLITHDVLGRKVHMASLSENGPRYVGPPQTKRKLQLIPVNAIVLPRPESTHINTPAQTMMTTSQRMPIYNNTRFNFSVIQNYQHSATDASVAKPHIVSSTNTAHVQPESITATATTGMVNIINQNNTSLPISKMTTDTCINNNSKISNSQSASTSTEQRNIESTSNNRKVSPKSTPPELEPYTSMTGYRRVNREPPYLQPSTSRDTYFDIEQVKKEPIEPDNNGMEQRGSNPNKQLLKSLLKQSAFVYAGSNSPTTFNKKGPVIDGEIDNLTDTINRVAAGEGELKLRPPFIDPRLTKPIEDNNEHEMTINAQNELPSVNDNSATGKTKKKRRKDKSKMKVNLVKSLPLPSVEDKKTCHQPDMESRYLTDPNVGFNTFEGVFRPESDAITEIEARKLSSVSGHHLLELTETEKEFLKNRRYISPVKQIDDKLHNSDTNGAKHRDNEQSMHVDNASTSNKVNHTSEVKAGKFHRPQRKETKGNRIPEQRTYSEVDIRTSTDMQLQERSNIPSSSSVNVGKPIDDPMRKQGNTHNTMFCVVNKVDLNKLESESSSTAPHTQYKSLIIPNTNMTKHAATSTDTKVDSSPFRRAPIASPQSQEKYIRLGNRNYRLVDNPRRSNLQRDTLSNLTSHVAVSSSSSTRAGLGINNPSISLVDINTQAKRSNSTPRGRTEGNLTVAELLKMKREAEIQKATTSNTHGVTNPLQIYGRAVNGQPSYKGLIIKLKDIVREGGINNSDITGQQQSDADRNTAIHIPGSTKTQVGKLPSVSQKSKVRLEIPIKIINPNGIVINKATNAIVNDQPSLNKVGNQSKGGVIQAENPVDLFPERPTKTSCIAPMMQIPRAYKGQQAWIEGHKRKTLPAPKPKNTMSAELRKKRSKRSNSLPRNKRFRGEFRKAVQIMMRKSKNPVMKLASCLELIPKEGVVAKERVSRGKKVISARSPTKGHGSPVCLSTEVRSKTKNAVKTTRTNLTNGTQNDQQLSTKTVATVVQIFKDENGHCKHSVQQIHLTLGAGKNNELHRWFPFADHPCVLHFSSIGLVEHLEVEAISRGLYVAIDCSECYPANQCRSVKTSLSMYPPHVCAIPHNTLALVFGNISEVAVARVVTPPRDDDDLDNVLVKVLGPASELPGPVMTDLKYGSITDNNLSPRNHSPAFYSKSFRNCFDIVTDSDSFEDVSNSNNNTCTSGSTGGLELQKGNNGTIPRISERAMALKQKQNELLECCKRLKTNKPARVTRKRKRENDNGDKLLVKFEKPRETNLSNMSGNGHYSGGVNIVTQASPVAELISCADYGLGENYDDTDEFINVDS